MSLKPKISIVTVVRNGEKEIEKTILSVICQTYTEIEYIVIDGNSSDKTLEMIKKYESHIVFWSTEPDRGIYDAMNKGLHRATGEYVIFLNCGDSFVEESSIERAILEVVSKGFPDVVIYNAVDDRGKLIGKFQKIESIKFETVGCHQAYMFKTKIHKRFPYNLDYRIKADRDVLLRIFMAGFSVIRVFQDIALFDLNGVSSSQILKKEKENVRISYSNKVGVKFVVVSCCLLVLRLSLYLMSKAIRVEWNAFKRKME